MNRMKKYRLEIILTGIMLLMVIGICAYNKADPVDYTMYDSSTISYVKAEVISVNKEDLEVVENAKERFLGIQNITVKMLNKGYDGELITFDNNLSTTHNVYAKPGSKLIIKADRPEGIEPFYSVYNYNRSTGMILIAAAFVLCMILVGKEKGLKSIISLLFTMFLIIGFLLPMIYRGYSPVVCSIVTILVTTSISMLLLNGYSAKTVTAISSTIAGVLVATLAFGVITIVLHLNGYNTEEAEELLLISEATGLQIEHILFSGILVASLGAVMDMCMSIATSLFEMKNQNPGMNFKEIVRAGQAIGQDMIGTMCATLILAFTGTAMTMLLVLVSYGVTMEQLLNSDFIAIEVAHSLTGGLAVVLSVPITAFITAYVLEQKQH